MSWGGVSALSRDCQRDREGKGLGTGEQTLPYLRGPGWLLYPSPSPPLPQPESPNSGVNVLTSALLDSQRSLLLCCTSGPDQTRVFQARSVPSFDTKTLALVLTWPNPASRGGGAK